MISLLDRIAEWRVGQDVTRLDKRYADSWAQTAMKLWRSRIYESLASSVLLQEGNIHLDAGSGLGLLLDALHVQQPNSTLIGVDSNRAMMSRAAAILSQNASSPVTYFSSRSLRKRDNTFDAEYFLKPSEIEKARHRVDEDGVILIQDDIRTMEVVKTILGDKKVDSATVTFPGVGNFEALAATDGLRDQVVSLRHTSFHALFRTIAEILAPGGQLVISDFVAVVDGGFPRPDQIRDDIFRAAYELMGESFLSFEQERLSLLSLPEDFEELPPEFISEERESLLRWSASRSGVFTASMRRN